MAKWWSVGTIPTALGTAALAVYNTLQHGTQEYTATYGNTYQDAWIQGYNTSSSLNTTQPQFISNPYDQNSVYLDPLFLAGTIALGLTVIIGGWQSAKKTWKYNPLRKIVSGVVALGSAAGAAYLQYAAIIPQSGVRGALAGQDNGYTDGYNYGCCQYEMHPHLHEAQHADLILRLAGTGGLLAASGLFAYGSKRLLKNPSSEEETNRLFEETYRTMGV